MPHGRARRARKGVALILGLFTTAILVTLSLAFLALAIGESRTSRGAAQEKAALEAANYGLEFTLNYMGLGTYSGPVGQNVTWERLMTPGGFGFFNVLKRLPSPRPHLINGTAVWIEDTSDDPNLINLSTSTDPVVRAAVRRLRLVLAAGPGTPAVLPFGKEWAFTFDVVIDPVLPPSGVQSFRLVSTAKVYNQNGANSTITDQALATRRVEAQVLPASAASYLHFLSNARGFNAQGIPKYGNQTVTLNGNTTAIADYAMIPGNFTENGPMRIDGESPAIKNITSPNPTVWSPLAWFNNSGNLKFAPDAVTKENGGNVSFQNRLTINAPLNEYMASGMDDTNSGFFSGGFSTQTPRLGLPKLDIPNITRAAQYVPNPNPQNMRAGYFSVETREIPGAAGSGVAAPRCSGPGGDPFYERFDTQTLPDGTTVNVPVAFDYRPRIPNVEVTIHANTVTVQKRDNLTGNLIGSPDEIQADRLSTGVIMVEGGNAVVKTDAPFKGQLSVVAGDHTGRAGAVPNDAIYSLAANELFTYEKNRWDHARDNAGGGGDLDPSHYATPPYTVAQLQAAKAAGHISTAPPNNVPTDHPLWPSPDASTRWDPNTRTDYLVHNVPGSVTREGNIVIADDVITSQDRTATLGLFAQNFVLFNDNTPDANNRTLTVDAVLTSRDRSVGLDWDNTGRQSLSSYQRYSSPGYNGILKIRGSIVGEFVDVEGDTMGRGYVVQDFTHNTNLNNLRPPLCPAWDFSILPGGFRFVITHYNDGGSLSTDKAL